MFQRVNWSTLKAFFSVSIRSSGTQGGRKVLFSSKQKDNLKEELLPRFSLVIELCPWDADERSFSHTLLLFPAEAEQKKITGAP